MRWLLAVIVVLAFAAPAHASTTWLCQPGLKHNPCDPGLKTTRATATGATQGTFTPSSLKGRPVDCFYVYPTVSDQPTPIATKRIDPEERSIALYQAARYSSVCRVYAPMYRQVTLANIGNAANGQVGYRDVRSAWRDYLEHDNHGRGVILIGHSQGTFVLRQLIAKEIDSKPAVRKRLISAILLGGNVMKSDFKHIAPCRSRTQLGCVIAFSTFNATPPPDAIFGHGAICTNPAALGGGAGKLDTILPSAPFAPTSSFGKVAPLIGYPAVKASTPWIESDGVYTAQCSSEGGADVLRISGTPVLQALPDATWGLHLVDGNIALGNLVGIVTAQARRYLKG